MERSGIAIVQDFIAAWNQFDMSRVESFLSPDVFYHNIPMEPLVGIPAFRAFMAEFPAASANWEVHAIAENGAFVLTERTDGFVLKNGSAISVRVMGTFEIADGKIKAWRDYFDLAEFTSQLTA